MKQAAKCIEGARNEGKIKGSLSAEVTLYCESGLSDALSALGEESVHSLRLRRGPPLSDASSGECLNHE